MPDNNKFGRFDFGLSEPDEERARALHRDSVIVDLMYWGPLGYRCFTEEMAQAQVDAFDGGGIYAAAPVAIRHILELSVMDPESYRELWRESGVTAGTRDWMLPSAAAGSYALGTLALATATFDAMPWLTKALRADDIRAAKREDRHAAFLNTQHVGDLTLEVLHYCHLLGLRMLMPTYNLMNQLGAGCTERTDAGLSHFGVQIVGAMNNLGIIVDTSHCGRQTTLDCCEASRQPVVASHTSAGALYAHDRSKSDEELQAIAATGGVIGICTVPFFLTKEPGATIDVMLDHIEHVASLVGVEHVAIGTDWPQGYPKEFLARMYGQEMRTRIGLRDEHNVEPTTFLIGFDDYRDFPNITRGLIARGYSDGAVKGILGENFLRVFEQVCG